MDVTAEGRRAVTGEWRDVSIIVEETAVKFTDRATDVVLRIPFSSISTITEVGEPVEGMHTIEISDISVGVSVFELPDDVLEVLLNRLTDSRDSPDPEKHHIPSNTPSLQQPTVQSQAAEEKRVAVDSYLRVSDNEVRPVSIVIQDDTLNIIEHSTSMARTLPFSTISAIDELGDPVDSIHTIAIRTTTGYGTAILTMPESTFHVLRERFAATRPSGTGGDNRTTVRSQTTAVTQSNRQSRNPARGVTVLAGLIFVASAAGAVGYWMWRERKIEDEQRVSDLMCALLSQPSWNCPTVTQSLVPFWLLIGLAIVALIIGTAAGIAAYLRRE